MTSETLLDAARRVALPRPKGYRPRVRDFVTAHRTTGGASAHGAVGCGATDKEEKTDAD